MSNIQIKKSDKIQMNELIQCGPHFHTRQEIEIREMGARLYDCVEKDAKIKYEKAKKDIESESSSDMTKANALFDLHHFYMYGWAKVRIHETYAMKLLEESAALGHLKASHELCRKLVEQKAYDKVDFVIQNALKKNQEILNQQMQCNMKELIFFGETVCMYKKKI